MKTYTSQIIHERSKIISISKNSPTNKEAYNNANEYSLKKNFFDPTKSSPPNDFLKKLHLRMSQFDSFIKADNRNKE
jgi:hypothetical protein